MSVRIGQEHLLDDGTVTSYEYVHLTHRKISRYQRRDQARRGGDNGASPVHKYITENIRKPRLLIICHLPTTSKACACWSLLCWASLWNCWSAGTASNTGCCAREAPAKPLPPHPSRRRCMVQWWPESSGLVQDYASVSFYLVPVSFFWERHVSCCPLTLSRALTLLVLVRSSCAASHTIPRKTDLFDAKSLQQQYLAPDAALETYTRYYIGTYTLVFFRVGETRGKQACASSQWSRAFVHYRWIMMNNEWWMTNDDGYVSVSCLPTRTGMPVYLSPEPWTGMYVFTCCSYCCCCCCWKHPCRDT